MTHLPENVASQDFVQNKAKWQKSCYTKFSEDKIERAKKRNATETDLLSGTKRIYPPRHSLDKAKCIFCEESCGKLHQLVHLKLTPVYTLLPKISITLLCLQKLKGDLIALESKYHLSCLAKLHNHHMSYLRENEENSSTLNNER